MSYIYPEKYLTRISKIDINSDIINLGFNNLLIDVDNTILTRDKSDVPDDVLNWIEDVKKHGLKICLISNDWHKNIVDLSKRLNLPIVVKSLKPLPHSFIIAMKKIGAKRNNTLMIGDQLTTDVFGAHNIGLPCYLLKPLVDEDLKHTLILRKFENIILNNKQTEK